MRIVIFERVNDSTAIKHRDSLYDNQSLQYNEHTLRYHGHLMTTADLDVMMQTFDTCAIQNDKFKILKKMLADVLQYALPDVFERVMPLLLKAYRQKLNALKLSQEQQDVQQQQKVSGAEKKIQQIKKEIEDEFSISTLHLIDDYSRTKFPGAHPFAPKTNAAIVLAIRQDQQKIMDYWVKLVSEDFFEFKGILLGRLRKSIKIFSASGYVAAKEDVPYQQMVLSAKEQLLCSYSLFNQSMRVVHQQGLFSKLTGFPQDHPIRQSYEERYGALKPVDKNENTAQQQI